MIFIFFLKLLLFLLCQNRVVCWVTNDFYVINADFIGLGNNVNTNMLDME